MSDDETQIAEEMTPDVDEMEAGLDHLDEAEVEDYERAHSVKADDAPRSQKEIEALNRKLDAEAERHAKRVAEIMGDDFALLVPSPIDWTSGFIFNVPGMLPAPSQLEALDAILGRATAQDYLPSEDVEPCEKCNALGRTLTGSRVEGQETKPCAKCNGSGFQTKLPPMQPSAAVTNIAAYTNGGSAEPNQFQVADRWGRPAGHPHYGLEPAYVGG